MDTENNIRDAMLQHAETLLYYINQLIEQCDRWLPAEEGNRNMEKRIEERKKKARTYPPLEGAGGGQKGESTYLSPFGGGRGRSDLPDTKRHFFY
jgi:hypothetical protein